MGCVSSLLADLLLQGTVPYHDHPDILIVMSGRRQADSLRNCIEFFLFHLAGQIAPHTSSPAFMAPMTSMPFPPKAAGQRTIS